MDKADRPNRMRTVKDLRSLLEGIPDGVRMVGDGSVMVGWVPDGTGDDGQGKWMPVPFW